MCETYIKVYGAKVRRLALRYAGSDLDLADDLEQEGLIAVWRFDPARVNGVEEAIVLRVARDAMRKWLRRERSAKIMAPSQRSSGARQPSKGSNDTKIVPIRRFAPSHLDAAPASDRRAA